MSKKKNENGKDVIRTLCSDLTAGEKVTLCGLLTYMNPAGECCATTGQVSARVKLSEGTVGKSIRKLRAMGVLTRTSRSRYQVDTSKLTGVTV